jgi:hypothetical protein
MKKVISVLFVIVFMFTALDALAKSSDTKEEALTSIKKSLEDPEVKAWVKKKYGSEKIFLKALAITPEKTVKVVAATFSDFQENGGEISFKDEEIKWISIALLGIILLIIIF